MRTFIKFTLLFFFCISSAFATVVSTENFDTNISGWGPSIAEANWDASQKLRIESQTTASKTYSFPAYAGRVVYFNMDATEGANFGGQDNVVITANGVEVINNQLRGSSLYTFETILDVNGETFIEIFVDTNKVAETLLLDNIVINMPVVITFALATYNVNENLALADYQRESVPFVILLSEAVTYDVEVDYVSRDDSAFGGIDFTTINGHLIIPAGDTNATRNMEIVHDPAIELIETFYIDMSNPEGRFGGFLVPDTVLIGTPGTTQVNISSQVTAPLCYEDDFEDQNLDDDWRTLRSSGGFTPEIVTAGGNSRLRLTSNQTNLATAITKDFEFRSSENLIIVEFDQFAYGGCNGGGGLGVDGADGIVAVLYDTNVGASPIPGARGGSVGYAQQTSVNGFEGGWLGLGIDEYGNFANCNEGRQGGLPGTSCDNGNGFNPQNYRNRVSIRGDGNGTIGYEFLAGSAELSPKVADKSNLDEADPSPGHRYRMTTDARDPAHLYITLERDIKDGNGYQLIINQFDAKDPVYNQITTPDFVRFALTSGTGGGCNFHEIDNISVYGVCRGYVIDAPLPDSADIVNDWQDIAKYNSGTHEITTKVAGSTATITGVHLDKSTYEATPYFAGTPGLTFSIIPYLTDSTCTTENINVWDPGTGQQLVIDLNPGDTVANGTMIVPPSNGGAIIPEAYQDRRFEMIVVDSSLLSAAGQDCILTSSTSGNFARIAQCANSEGQYTSAFGQAAWDRCGESRGKPCKSSNGGVADTSDPSYNPATDSLYVNDLGCYMCTFNVQPSCSTDNFAIRPERFEVTTTHPHYPDLLRAGEDSNLSIVAYNYNTDNPTYKYTQGESNITITETRWLNSPRVEDTADLLSGQARWTSDFNITNGVSNEAGFNYDDVGFVSVRVEDRKWAFVDLDDTPQTCDDNGAFICGENNMTFIPDHFTILDMNITSSDGKNDDTPGQMKGITYFANITNGDISTYGMAAHVQIRVAAMTAQETVTQNFQDGDEYYENPLTLSTIVTDGGSMTGTAITASSTIIDEQDLGFGISPDMPGNKTLHWDDTNTSQILLFNFPRVVNQPINPFRMDASNVFIEAQSDYEQTAVIGYDTEARITGDLTGADDANITIYYGRQHVPRNRVVGANATVTIYHEFYCNTNVIAPILDCTITDHNATDISPNELFSPDAIRWYQMIGHQVARDGTSLSTRTRDGVDDARITGAADGITGTYVYDETKGYPYKVTIEIVPDPWLIYHQFDSTVTRNTFELEYHQAGNWAGDANSGSKTDSGPAANTNRRIQW